MKFASGLALIAVAIAAASTNALTFDANQPFVEGPGPEIFPTPAPTPDTSSSATGSLGPVGSSSSSGFSSTCAMDCPSDYIPVCGSDGVTYGNTCKLVLASCQSANKDISKKSDGPCP